MKNTLYPGLQIEMSIYGIVKPHKSNTSSLDTKAALRRYVERWFFSEKMIAFKAAFHPKEPIIGSCGIDKTIYLGELTEY